MHISRGRFAPSPTGSPHFGTLLGAVASFVHARATGAQWLIRIEDIDQDRVVPGAADEMLRTLDKFGLEWDGSVVYQSQRINTYQNTLEALLESGHAFPCGCTRRDFIDGKYGPEGPVYPGTCRDGLDKDMEIRSYRMRVEDRPLQFEDLVQGSCIQNLKREIGDFVIKRADGYFAYQLAVVVDDAWQGITQVVRGCDLLGSTQRQIYLQQTLGYPSPEYLHFPVITGQNGKKLSKSDQAPSLSKDNPDAVIFRALSLLGQSPPEGLAADELLIWAIQNWDVSEIPKVQSLPLDK